MGTHAEPSQTAETPPWRWKTAIFLAGSVAFGGLALVLWNRRELGRLQAQKNVCERTESIRPGEEEY